MYSVCLGDSICYGEGVRPDQAWVALLAAALPGVRVRNAGISGETAKDGQRRLPPLLGPPAPDLLYLQFGLNDAWLDLVSADVYAATLRDMVVQALESGVREVLLGTNHPVWVEGMYGYYPVQVRAFNAALREAFAVPPERLTLVDIERHWDTMGTDHAALLQPDGVHLSPAGNRAYADLLIPIFTKKMHA